MEIITLILVVILYIIVGEVKKTMSEYGDKLLALKDQLVKAKAEILKKIADLEAAIASGVAEDVKVAFEALAAEVKGIDDIGDPNV
jgi:hypothetical protein